MIKTIQSNTYQIEIGSLVESSFASLLREQYNSSRKIILVDENTHDFCLEYLITSFDELKDAEVMLLPVGEENKVMEVCFQVWEAFTEYRFERSDLVINLGGGVVTDMGGFIASIYKRGLDFIQIPTSLLAMVDASIGGKTGIDLGVHKNQLGVFSNPKAVFIDPGFLHSLPEEELASGYAEMLKHGLLGDLNHWNDLKTFDGSIDFFSAERIETSLQIKNKIVLADPLEKNERKKLNVGHTIGHALESFFLLTQPISHGHAVALGILAESFIAHQKQMLSNSDFIEIKAVITQFYPMVFIPEEEFSTLISFAKNDKKNKKREILAALLCSIGEVKINVPITTEEIENSCLYLNSLCISLN